MSFLINAYAWYVLMLYLQLPLWLLESKVHRHHPGPPAGSAPLLLLHVPRVLLVNPELRHPPPRPPQR